MSEQPSPASIDKQPRLSRDLSSGVVQSPSTECRRPRRSVSAMVAPIFDATIRQRQIKIKVPDEQAVTSYLYDVGNGTHEAIDSIPEEALSKIREELNKPKHLLSQWPATAICGNDVMSSCSYSPGVVATYAGTLSPFAFLLVTFALYAYRYIYTEVVTAIPLNGGSYNVLLNTSSKRFAAFSACCSTLCYVATSVVSSTPAAHYIKLLVCFSCVLRR